MEQIVIHEPTQYLSVTSEPHTDRWQSHEATEIEMIWEKRHPDFAGVASSAYRNRFRFPRQRQ